MAAVSVESVSFDKVRRRYEKKGESFVDKYGSSITGLGGAKFEAVGGQQTCAIRLSMALYLAGVKPPRVNNSWLYTVRDDAGEVDRVYLPSLAGDYANGLIISGGQELSGRVSDQGVIYFGGGFRGASGHVTLWDGHRAWDGGEYWNQPKIIFWKMAP